MGQKIEWLRLVKHNHTLSRESRLEGMKQAEVPKVEVVENPVLEAYRRHLQDGSDYKLVYRDYLIQSWQEVSDAVRRRATESLRNK